MTKKWFLILVAIILLVESSSHLMSLLVGQPQQSISAFMYSAVMAILLSDFLEAKEKAKHPHKYNWDCPEKECHFTISSNGSEMIDILRDGHLWDVHGREVVG